MKIKTTVAGLTAWILFVIAPVQAHHSLNSEFDKDKLIHLEGKVTQIEWGNPHVYFHVEVADSKGLKTDWRVELLSVNNLMQLGMTRLTIGIGRDVVVDGLAAKTGGRLVAAMEFRLNHEGKTYSLTEMWNNWIIPTTTSRTNGKRPAVLPLPTFKGPTPTK